MSVAASGCQSVTLMFCLLQCLPYENDDCVSFSVSSETKWCGTVAYYPHDFSQELYNLFFR